MSLDGKIALVTGASRGIGRGIALQLGAAGATVYITGRSPKLALEGPTETLPTLQKTAEEINERGGNGIAVYVDHSKMDEVEKLFRKIEAETDGVLDILVNNAFSAVNTLVEHFNEPFWKCDPDMWDDVNNVGLRNHYYCSVYGARLMVPRKKGLIVNISSFGGMKYFFNVAYGVGKCAMDRMAGDMAEELRTHNVTMISLWPGCVRTELTVAHHSSGTYSSREELKVLENVQTESPEYTGKAVVALASEPNVMRRTGRVVVVAEVAAEHKFKDIDGAEPGSLRSFKVLLTMGGFGNIAAYFPPWLRVPGWMITAFYSRL